MPHVTFKFNKEKDAKNYYDCANSDPTWGNDFTKSLRPEVLKKLKGKKWTEVKKDTINMLKRGYSKDKERNEKKLKEIQKSWDKINDEYFKRLAKITKHKIYTDKFTSYITTIGRCPYNPKNNWFMTNLFWSVDNSLTTIAHELMHLQVHFYFEKSLKRNVSPAKFHDIKEASTVLLNLEFTDLLKIKDCGYPSHKKLRFFIEKQWGKNPDFDILLDKCVKYLNK